MFNNCLDFEQQHCEFTTYYGEKVYGLLVEPEDVEDKYFIVPNILEEEPFRINLKEWRNEGCPGDSETLKKFGGIEVQDEDVIVKCEKIEGNPYPYPEGGSVQRSGNLKAKKLIIFGAGASYGFSYDPDKNKEWRPPLARDLFHEDYYQFYTNYPGVSKNLSSLRFNASQIELFLQQNWEQIKKRYNPDLLRDHINIQYYLQYLFEHISKNNQHHEADLFHVFFKHLRTYYHHNPNELVPVVTFNYDTLIEQALEKVWDFKFSKMDDYLDLEGKRGVNLFKVHGSWNWGWPFRTTYGPDMENHLYTKNKTLDEIYFKLLGDEKSMAQSGYGKTMINKDKIELILESEDKRYFPALFLPYTDKDEFFLPNKHYAHLNNYLEEDPISELIIIGWTGNEAYFNRFLKERLKNTELKVYVADPNFEVVKQNLGFLNKAEFEKVENFQAFCKEKLSEVFPLS